MIYRNMSVLSRASAGITIAVLAFGSGCGGSKAGSGTNTTSSGTIPLVTPIVKAALPPGLGGSASTHSDAETRLSHMLSLENDNTDGNCSTAGGSEPCFSLDVSNLQSRFFASEGPTEIVGQLMPQLDSLITNVNQLASDTTQACLSQTPVSYTITPGGHNVTMYAQCYTTTSASYSAGTDGDGNAHAADPAFIQFGINDGVIYVWSADGAEWVAAIITPDGTGYTVTAYLGVGYSNFSMTGTTGGDWDSGSYGLVEFTANSNAGTFELATAGIGLGFCGAQLVSDGANIYAELSNDMGTTCAGAGGTAGDYDELCVSAADVSTASSTCTGASAFTLAAIGRESAAGSANTIIRGGTWAASPYPTTGPNVLFNGSETDALHFGPTTATTGATALTSGGGGNGGGTLTAAQLGADIHSACPSVPLTNATTAATAGLAAYNSQGQNAAITALNTSLANQGYTSEESCADTAAENAN